MKVNISKRDPILTRLLDMGFWKILFKVLAFVFKPVFKPLSWLFDKLSEWKTKRSLVRKIWYQRIWIVFHVQMVVYFCYNTWKYFNKHDELSTVATAGLVLLWILLSRKEIKDYRQLFWYTHNQKIEVGEVILVGKNNDVCVVKECVQHPQSTRLWNVKVRPVNKEEKVVIGIMTS